MGKFGSWWCPFFLAENFCHLYVVCSCPAQTDKRLDPVSNKVSVPNRGSSLLSSWCGHDGQASQAAHLRKGDMMKSPLTLELTEDIHQPLCIAWDAEEDCISGRRRQRPNQRGCRPGGPGGRRRWIKMQQRQQRFFEGRFPTVKSYYFYFSSKMKLYI